MTAKEAVQKLKAEGWEEVKGGKTAHKHFKHPKKHGKVTVSMHKGDIPLPAVKSIEKQSGVKLT